MPLFPEEGILDLHHRRMFFFLRVLTLLARGVGGIRGVNQGRLHIEKTHAPVFTTNKGETKGMVPS